MPPLTQFRQGTFTLYIGPVRSEKTTRLEALLDVAHDGQLMSTNRFLVLKHPKDDPALPDSIGKHNAHPVSQADEIAKLVTQDHQYVVIAGISHFEDPRIVSVVDCLVRSNRNVIASGPNLDGKGAPYHHIPGLLTLADDVHLLTAICSHPGCRRENACRSKKIDGSYEPRCLHHFTYEGSPKISADMEGRLQIVTGGMYASKSKEWYALIKRKQAAHVPYAVFTWIGNQRYNRNAAPELFGPGHVTLHSGETVPAILIQNTDNLLSYLQAHPDLKDVFLDEAQFLDADPTAKFRLTSTLPELLAQGYKFYATMLVRTFKRTPFLYGADVMALATHIQIKNAVCKVCKSAATESQRMKVIEGQEVPAHYDDPLVAVGGDKDSAVKYFYEARCLPCFKLPGEPAQQYAFPELRTLSF